MEDIKPKLEHIGTSCETYLNVIASDGRITYNDDGEEEVDDPRFQLLYSAGACNVAVSVVQRDEGGGDRVAYSCDLDMNQVRHLHNVLATILASNPPD